MKKEYKPDLRMSIIYYDGLKQNIRRDGFYYHIEKKRFELILTDDDGNTNVAGWCIPSEFSCMIGVRHWMHENKYLIRG